MTTRDCFIGIDFGKTNVRFAIAGDRPKLKYFTKRSYHRGSPDEMHRQIFALTSGTFITHCLVVRGVAHVANRPATPQNRS